MASDDTLGDDLDLQVGQKVRFAAGYKGAPKPRASGSICGSRKKAGKAGGVLYDVNVVDGSKMEVVRGVPRHELTMVGPRLKAGAKASASLDSTDSEASTD